MPATRQGVSSLPQPALPLLALLPGGPLLLGLGALWGAAGAARGAHGGAGPGGSGSGSPLHVREGLAAALARLPSLATADDRTQVRGEAGREKGAVAGAGRDRPPRRALKLACA